MPLIVNKDFIDGVGRGRVGGDVSEKDDLWRSNFTM